MSKAVISIIIVIILVGAGYYFFANRSAEPYTAPSSTQAPSQTQSPATSSPAPAAESYTVSMTANGFSPASLAIKVGDTVVFKNTDTGAHWPASDPHPIHNICPGFDALSGVAPGGSYSRTFTVAKVCPYHDHLSPHVKGTITVTE